MRIKSLREQHQLTQKQLANAISVSQQTISGYENGSRVPDQNTLELLADYFKCSIDYLVGKSDIKNWDDLLQSENQKIIHRLDRLNHEDYKFILNTLKFLEEKGEYKKDTDA